ncbi:hypothetical protein WMY93_004116 [Mugilogobius chulae]|uniref:L-type lectin-like domain-containing protein n=1 Tax=Mugilogobius chulae TaxID=88201 RepID=A0AAW0PMP6_9GOBI
MDACVSSMNRIRSLQPLSSMSCVKSLRKCTYLFIIVCVTIRVSLADEFEMDEFLKREYSLIKPYGALHSGILWGTAVITPDYIRLTPDSQSRQGAVWSRIPFYLSDWELKVHFKVHGQGKKNFNGDGLAIWLTKERMQNGPVFGNINKFTGLGIFVDTYPNAEKQHDRAFPYISLMLGNSTLEYEHDKDGRPSELGAAPRWSGTPCWSTLTVNRRTKTVRLCPAEDASGYYLGASSATGDLTDNHDLISLKVYQLTVERDPEEEEEEVLLPRVDNMDQFHVDVPEEGMSGVQIFIMFLFSSMGLGVLGVVGLIVYGRWKENKRKRFY